MYLPEGKKSDPLLSQAYRWCKGRDPLRMVADSDRVSADNELRFSRLLADLDANGSSEEHNLWRSRVVAAINDLRPANLSEREPAGTI